MRAERIAAAVLSVALLLAACGGPDAVAVVDGTPIEAEVIRSLHPPDFDLVAEERAASVFLVILHRLLVEEAEREFGFVATASDLEHAFAARTSGLGEQIDERLAARGVTRRRVMLEAELDLVRSALQRALVERGGAGVDIDTAYRRFLGANSVACVQILTPTTPDLNPELEALAEAGATFEEIETEFDGRADTVDLGCSTPLQLPPPVAPLAVDGVVGRVYIQHVDDETVYAAVVSERDAPVIEAVMEEVIGIAADTQGRVLFDQWASGLLQDAEVEVDAAVGSWTTTPDSNGIPTVVAP